MRFKPVIFLLISAMTLLAACSAAQPTPETAATLPATQTPAALATTLPTEAVSTGNIKDAYPGAPTPDTSAYPGAQPASDPSNQGYPAPDPTTGLAATLQPTLRFKVAEVDSLLDILFGDKAADLASRIIYEQVACTKADGLSGPPKCAEGEAEGTKLDVLPILGGEGSFLRKNDANLKDLPGSVELLAAFKVSPDYKPEEYYPAGDYGVVVRLKNDNSKVITLRVTADGIVRVDTLNGPPSPGEPDIANYLNPAQ